MIQNDKNPARTVARPSIIKIHAQPGFPPIPSIFEIATFRKVKSVDIPGKLHIPHTASKPPNAPDTDAAEKKSATRMPNSERLYQLKGDEFKLEAMTVTHHER